MSDYYVRWMIESDLAQVLRIERASFRRAQWTERDFRTTLRHRNCIGHVAESSDGILGYMLYELHPTYLHLLNFAVDPDYRREGVGTRMLDKFKYKVGSHHRQKAVLRVSESNLEAQLFFRFCGFQAVSVEPHYYPDFDDDAYMLEWWAACGNPVRVTTH